MALFLVLEDFSDGSATISAGSVIDDAAIDLPRLQASGLAALAYVPGTMEASRLAFLAARGSRVVEPDTSGDLMALLIAAGAVPTGVASVSAAAPLVASAAPNVTLSIAPGTAAGDVVKWDGAQWTVGTPDVGITELTGDVLAGPGNGAQAATVARLQGYSVAAIAPSLDGQVLTWNGSDWVPGLPPAGGSGGGGQTYFLNNGTAGDAPLPAAGTKELGLTAEAPLTTVTSGILSNMGVYSVVAGFVTDLNKPGLTTIPTGLWDFNVWANAGGPSLVPNVVRFRLKIYLWDGVTATLLATSGVVPLYDPNQVVQYFTSALMPQTVILATDRIYVEIEATATANNHTITVSFGDAAPTHVHTTLPSIAGTGIVHVINGVVQSPASPVNLAGGATEITGTLPVANGGTALSAAPTNGQLLIGNGTGYTQATLTAGSGITITNGAGSIAIAASGAVPVLEQDRMFVYEGEYFDDVNDEWREPKGNQAILARSGGTATTVANWSNSRPAVLCSGGRMQVANAVTSTPGNVLTVAVAGTYTLLSATNVGCFNIGNANKIFGVVNGLVAGVAKLQLWPTAAAPIAAMHITSTAFGGNKFVYVARYMQRAYRHTIYVQGVGTFSASSTDATVQPFSYSDLAIGGWFTIGGVYEQPIACLHAYRYKSDAEMDAIRDALQAAYAL